jgi:hypothetical protein
MTKLQTLFEQCGPLLDYKTRMIFIQIIEEIENLKMQPVKVVEENTEEWLRADDFVAKYPAFDKGYLGTLRTNCSDANQKFFKGGSYNPIYNPKETFRYIMSLQNGKGRIKSNLTKNNFFGVKMESE